MTILKRTCRHEFSGVYLKGDLLLEKEGQILSALNFFILLFKCDALKILRPPFKLFMKF